MSPRFRVVQIEDWQLERFVSSERSRRLLNSLSPEDLSASLCAEAMQEAASGRIKLCWCPSSNLPGPVQYYRLEAYIPVSTDVFDQFLNGRSGYRAQFYLSPEEGILFTRFVIDGLMPALDRAYQRDPLGVPFGLIERSLRTAHAKISIDDRYFADEPDTLVVQRWINNGAYAGLKAPRPGSPSIDVLGSFIDPLTDAFAVAKRKETRPCELYSKGFA